MGLGLASNCLDTGTLLLFDCHQRMALAQLSGVGLSLLCFGATLPKDIKI